MDTHGLGLGIAGVIVCIMIGRWVEKRYFTKRDGDDK